MKKTAPRQAGTVVSVAPVRNGAALGHIRALFREYEAFLGISLDFQDFEAEMAALPGKYAPPSGELYLALEGERPVGCAAFYRMVEGVCELKRLYVVPQMQGRGIGRLLFDRALEEAKARGYHTLRLDSFRWMEAAGRMYLRAGFVEIPPYNHNPYPGVYYMEKRL